MKHPRLKRIKLRADGYYYPQARWFFFWCDYDAYTMNTSTCTSVRFSSEASAREFLNGEHMQDLKKIALTKQAKILKWKAA